MRIATWNVNSIKQRVDNLTAWLSERQPDIVCLQETFNGVALLSKFPLEDVTARLPGDEADNHARFMEAAVSTAQGALRVASVYLPNGNPPDTDKYSYKISWMDRLIHYAHERLQ